MLRKKKLVVVKRWPPVIVGFLAEDFWLTSFLVSGPVREARCISPASVMLNALAEGGSFKIFLYLLGIITCRLLLSSFQSVKNVDLRLLMCICFNISFLGIALLYLAVILPIGLNSVLF